MTLRSTAWKMLMLLGSILAAGVTLHGVYTSLGIDLRENTILTSAYGLLPILCFPVFFLVQPQRRASRLLLILACGFVAAYSALNWRTCAELGYCTSIASTVLVTLGTRMVLAYFAVGVISFIASAVDGRVPHR